MSEKKIVKPVALAIGAALAGTFAISGAVNAEVLDNPFEMSALSSGYMLGAGGAVVRVLVVATPMTRRAKVLAARKKAKVLVARKKVKVLVARKARKKVKVLAARKKAKVLVARKKVKVLAARKARKKAKALAVKVPAAVLSKTDTTLRCDEARACARAFLCLQGRYGG